MPDVAVHAAFGRDVFSSLSLMITLSHRSLYMLQDDTTYRLCHALGMIITLMLDPR